MKLYLNHSQLQVMCGILKEAQPHRFTIFSGGKQFLNILPLRLQPLFAVTCLGSRAHWREVLYLHRLQSSCGSHSY